MKPRPNNQCDCVCGEFGISYCSNNFSKTRNELAEYVIEHTSIESQLTFARMLPSLPGPGTSAFAKLVKALHPFGISPSGVTVDTPSSRMSDVVLSIVLLDKRVGIRITAASLELLVNGLFADDDNSLITIVDSVFDALRSIDEESVAGAVSHRVTSHFKLTNENALEFLAKHQVSNTLDAGLVVDAIAYKVNRRESDSIHASEIRFVLAKSLLYKNALFVDLNATYPELTETAMLFTWMNSDFDRTLAMLDLIEATDANNE